MKTKEFIKRVEELGYAVIEKKFTLNVCRNKEEIISISEFMRSVLHVDSRHLELIKLSLEYAETPIEEREEEKRYVVIIPDWKNTERHKYGIANHGGHIGLGFYQVSWFRGGLTEKEIKLNHEYLWQFAQEVEQ